MIDRARILANWYREFWRFSRFSAIAAEARMRFQNHRFQPVRVFPPRKPLPNLRHHRASAIAVAAPPNSTAWRSFTVLRYYVGPHGFIFTVTFPCPHGVHLPKHCFLRVEKLGNLMPFILFWKLKLHQKLRPQQHSRCFRKPMSTKTLPRFRFMKRLTYRFFLGIRFPKHMLRFLPTRAYGFLVVSANGYWGWFWTSNALL